MLEAEDKKELKEQLEYIKSFVENEVDDWYWKSTLRDELRQLEIILQRNAVI